MTDKQEDLAFARAISWIHRELGRVDDLLEEVISVIWVTVYRSMETGLEAESKGGTAGLVKDMLVNAMAYKAGVYDERAPLKTRLEESTLSLQFLQRMISAIRQGESNSDRLENSELLIDLLKWEILDVFDMSLSERLMARRSATADPLYHQPVPSVILGVR